MGSCERHLAMRQRRARPRCSTGECLPGIGSNYCWDASSCQVPKKQLNFLSMFRFAQMPDVAACCPRKRAAFFEKHSVWNCNIAMFWSHGQWTDLQLSENFRSNKFCSVLGDCFHIRPSVVMCRSFHMITWHMTWETTCPFARLHIMSGLCSECLVGSSRSAMFPSINQSEAILDWI